MEDDFEHFRVVVETLTDEFDVMQVALAAVKLAHESASGEPDEEEIPQVSPPSKRDGRERPNGERPEGRRGRGPSGPTTRIFVGAGRAAGVRPQDLVGAITGESSLVGRDIGAIEISDRFALVEVPAGAADEVVSALRSTKIKGKKATIRRDAAR